MEKKIVVSESRPSLLQAAIFIAVGLVLVIWSKEVLSFIVELVGASIIAVGAISLIAHYDIRRRHPDVKKMFPVESYASIIFGVILFLFPEFFISILMLILGIMVVLGSLAQIYSFFQLKRLGASFTNIVYVSPVLMLLIGLTIILNPYHFASVLLISLFGIFSLMFGITSLARYFIQRKYYTTTL